MEPTDSIFGVPPRKVILWDVDGTLVWIGAATRQAFDRAVGSVLRQAVGDHGVSFGGKTDPQIALEILAFASASSMMRLAVPSADCNRALRWSATDLVLTSVVDGAPMPASVGRLSVTQPSCGVSACSGPLPNSS